MEAPSAETLAPRLAARAVAQTCFVSLRLFAVESERAAELKNNSALLASPMVRTSALPEETQDLAERAPSEKVGTARTARPTGRTTAQSKRGAVSRASVVAVSHCRAGAVVYPSVDGLAGDDRRISNSRVVSPVHCPRSVRRGFLGAGFRGHNLLLTDRGSRVHLDQRQVLRNKILLRNPLDILRSHGEETRQFRVHQFGILEDDGGVA